MVDDGCLIAGIAMTGARPGDLRKARRSQFDARTSSISFSAKGHPRKVPLPQAALPLFERLVKDELPNAWLFTRDDGKPSRDCPVGQDFRTPCALRGRIAEHASSKPLPAFRIPSFSAISHSFDFSDIPLR
jgi:integrase